MKALAGLQLLPQLQNTSGMASLGAGETYTRDDGTQGNLGENCVKYARVLNSSVPWGLWNKQDKQNAVAKAGSPMDMNIQPGSAIFTAEGSQGHVAIVESVDLETQTLSLIESNYQSGQVTSGRQIAMNDPMIYGYVPQTTQTGTLIAERDTEFGGAEEGEHPGVDQYMLFEQVYNPQSDFDILALDLALKQVTRGDLEKEGYSASQMKELSDRGREMKQMRNMFLTGNEQLEVDTIAGGLVHKKMLSSQRFRQG